MLKEEFEKRTGIYPSERMYCVIEQHYNDFEGDKDQFCAAYLKNDKYYFFDGAIFSFSEAFIKKGAVSFIFDKNVPEKVAVLSAEIKILSAV